MRMDLTERVWDVVDWIHLAQDTVQGRGRMNTVKGGEYLV
jgi:hypothetical protein